MAPTHEMLGYTVIAILGHGARSTIYAVRDHQDHLFALKHVAKASPMDQRYLDQAMREHHIASALNHPVLRKSFHLIRHRKLLRTSEVHVLMEMVDGWTLEQERPTDLLELCRIFQRVAQGLSAMHEAGFVHADIKPNNIMVDDTGTVKIIDFGQSCPVGTIKKHIQGTPDYIAPEQVLRHRITSHTDVFNLGATMYWLTTGQYVPTMMPRSKAHRSDDPFPAPRELNPQIPPALSSLVMNCVARSPYERPDSMQRVQDRLDLAVQQLTRETKG